MNQGNTAQGILLVVVGVAIIGWLTIGGRGLSLAGRVVG